MSTDAPRLAPVSGRPLRIGLVAARYNQPLVDALLERTVAALRSAGVRSANLPLLRVPGSGELPVAVGGLIARHRPHAVIALGVIVKGDTIHYAVLAESVAHALQRAALDAGTPVVNGVVTAGTAAQAAARARGRLDRGAEFARAALAMAALKRGGWR